MIRRATHLGLFLLLVVVGGGGAHAGGEKPITIAVLGPKDDGHRLEAAADGARIAAAAAGRPVRIEVLDTGGDAEGLERAVRKAKASATALALAGAPAPADLWKAAHSFRGPVYLLSGMTPDLLLNPGNVRHLAPSPAAEAIAAADALLAPLSARRVGVLHEDSAWGREVASGLAKNLSPWITLAGIAPWPEGDLAEAARKGLARIHAFEADWIYVALRGAASDALVRALEEAGETRALLFADGNRRASLLALGPEALSRAVFVGGPDPEMESRAGETLLLGLEQQGLFDDALAARAFEAVRRTVATVERAGRTKPRAVTEALAGTDPGPGTLGPLVMQPTGAPHFFPFRLWMVREGRLAPWPEARVPTPGCGPPLGFRRPPPAAVNERRGRIGFLTWGDEDIRTIDKNLEALGLSTSGADPGLDERVRQEILGRAIRIAHRLFRREADGTPVRGWSWGMTFSADPPPEDLPHRMAWRAIIAGDHPAAGGQVIGDGLVAVYATFLVRTMYADHALDPPLSAADRKFLDGTWRWADAPSLRLRADKIRCLLDGFASAIGLTLSHEFGHLCGCGHDTESPSSIMNVVAGAGASWEKAVWIPRHQVDLTRTLGLEGER